MRSNLLVQEILKVKKIAFEHILIVSVLFLGLGSSLPLHAQKAKQIDPTDFVTQFGLKNEWTDKQGGGYKNRFIPRFEYAASGSLAFRFELPVVANNIHKVGYDTDFGVGDLSTQFRWRVKKGQGFKLITGLGVTWDTASEPILGGRKKLISPFVRYRTARSLWRLPVVVGFVHRRPT